MFRLISIQQTDDDLKLNPSERPIRCLILADNTTDPLPTDGTSVDGMYTGQKFMSGSVAITTALDIAVVGNNGQCGDWV